MRWKSVTNLITLIILSIAYTIVTLLNIIGPLHTNETGNINPLSAITLYSIIYWVFALLVSWGVYFTLRKKPALPLPTLPASTKPRKRSPKLSAF